MRPEDWRAVGTLAFVHGLVHGNILSIPVLLAFAWGPEFGLDSLGIGALAAVAYVCFGVGSLPFGRLADRREPRGLLGGCLAGIAASMAAVALSPSIAVLAGALAALGATSSAYHPTGLSFISRTVREQGRGMGWHGMGGSLGIALEPALVSLLIAVHVPWRLVVAGMAMPAIAAFLLVFAQRPAAAPPPPADAGIRSALRNLRTPAFALVLAVYTLAGIAYWGSLTFLPGLVGPGSYSLLLALGAAGQVLSGRLADRPRPHRTLFRLSGVAAVVLATLALGIPAVSTAGAWGFGFLLFSLEPLQNTLVTESAPRETRGLAFGLTFLSVFGLGSIGAVVAGALLAAGVGAIMFVILAASLGGSGVCALWAGRRIEAGLKA